MSRFTEEELDEFERRLREEPRQRMSQSRRIYIEIILKEGNDVRTT